MIDFLIDSGIPFIIVLTKADKLNKTERAKRTEAFKTELPSCEGLTVVEFSAVTDEGVGQLREIVGEIAGQ